MTAKATYSRVAQYEADMEGLQIEISRYAWIVHSWLSTEADATYSRVAQYEVEMEGLQTENSRYTYRCTFSFIHSC